MKKKYQSVEEIIQDLPAIREVCVSLRETLLANLVMIGEIPAPTYLAGLPQTKNLNGFSLVHSSLDYPESWRYLMRPHDAEASFLIQKSPLVFAGHTHVPTAFYWQKDLPVQGGVFKKIHLTPSRKWFVNPGSTGQPRDCDPRASYAVYDPERRVVVVCRVEYDIVEAQRKIRESGLPERNAERLAIGR